MLCWEAELIQSTKHKNQQNNRECRILISVFSVKSLKLYICFKLTGVFKSCQSEGLSRDCTTATVLGAYLKGSTATLLGAIWKTILRRYLGPPHYLLIAVYGPKTAVHDHKTCHVLFVTGSAEKNLSICFVVTTHTHTHRSFYIFNP